MILDTCALLWLVQGGGELSEFAREQISAARVVHVSAISGFEIALKHSLKKLTLPHAPDKWFHQTLEHHSLAESPITLNISIRAAMLPMLHRDPCDRFIIATALENHWPIVTKDPLFAPYGVTVIS